MSRMSLTRRPPQPQSALSLGSEGAPRASDGGAYVNLASGRRAETAVSEPSGYGGHPVPGSGPSDRGVTSTRPGRPCECALLALQQAHMTKRQASRPFLTAVHGLRIRSRQESTVLSDSKSRVLRL